jgi:hypothetical protein
MLTGITLNVLPAQASFISCKQLFSAKTQIGDDQCSWLGTEHFEHLQMLKFVWQEEKVDFAAWNLRLVKQVDIDEFMELPKADDEDCRAQGDEQAQGANEEVIQYDNHTT